MIGTTHQYINMPEDLCVETKRTGYSFRTHASQVTVKTNESNRRRGDGPVVGHRHHHQLVFVNA